MGVLLLLILLILLLLLLQLLFVAVIVVAVDVVCMFLARTDGGDPLPFDVTAVDRLPPGPSPFWPWP